AGARLVVGLARPRADGVRHRLARHRGGTSARSRAAGLRGLLDAHTLAPAARPVLGSHRTGHLGYLRFMADLIDDFYRQNAWANLQLIEVCSALNDEQLDASAPGSYGSIRDTLVHLVGAEALNL